MIDSIADKGNNCLHASLTPKPDYSIYWAHSGPTWWQLVASYRPSVGPTNVAVLAEGWSQSAKHDNINLSR